MKAVKKLTTLILILIVGYCNLSNAEHFSTVFTYEGYFRDSSASAKGIYESERYFRFSCTCGCSFSARIEKS